MWCLYIRQVSNPECGIYYLWLFVLRTYVVVTSPQAVSIVEPKGESIKIWMQLIILRITANFTDFVVMLK